MNIVCGLPGPAGAWRRAGDWLGHRVVEINPARFLDAFRLVKPDVVLLGEEWLTCDAVNRWLATYAGRLAVLKQPGINPACSRVVDLVLERWPDGLFRPALDARPDTQPGTPRPEFDCDVAFVGQYHRGLDKYLVPLCSSFMRVKVFGDGDFPVPQYLGSISPSEVADVYASARVSVDLGGEPSRVLAVWAAGGYCVTAAPFRNTGVGLLDATPGASDPAEFVSLVRRQVGERTPPPASSRGGDGLLADTFADRLKEILEALP